MGEGTQRFDCPPSFDGTNKKNEKEPSIYRGVIDPRRVGDLVTERGRNTGLTAKLELVETNSGIAGSSIDPEGEKRTGDLASPDSLETKKDFVEEYLEVLFRKFSGEKIFRVTEINKNVLGNSVDLSIKPGEYVYNVPRSQLAEMENLFDKEVPALSIDTQGIKFSCLTGQDNDNLKKNNLGFSRKLVFGGQTFEIKFMCLDDGTTDDNKDEEINELSN